MRRTLARSSLMRPPAPAVNRRPLAALAALAALAPTWGCRAYEDYEEPAPAGVALAPDMRA
ncbi:MAG: hypothetical protein FJ138_10650, partial [Deltaproteobacteria bacterium]|nr:hypothetical protein [Deltaproteobacteria bacterium]